MTYLLDWKLYFIQIILAIICILLYVKIFNVHSLFTYSIYKVPLYTFVWTCVASFYFAKMTFKNRDIRRLREQLEAMKSGGFIAHELRTPLRTIHTYTDGIQTALPELLKGYEYAKQQAPDKFKMPERRLRLLENAMDTIKKETDISFNTIDMLLIKVNQESKIDASNYTSVSIADVVTETLARYPFDNEQQSLVHWDPATNSDFTFHGDEILTTHILFNLLRNALYQISVANKGEIYITTQSTENHNELIVKDTATGIPKASLPYVFDRTFSTSEKGIGLGLNFCKSVMESYQGKITCDSILGEYTEFILRFPK